MKKENKLLKNIIKSLKWWKLLCIIKVKILLKGKIGSSNIDWVKIIIIYTFNIYEFYEFFKTNFSESC